MSAPSESPPSGKGVLLILYESFALAFCFGASSAPTPLYRLYQQQWDLSPVTLTVIFAIYAISFLGALLTVGALSDYVGRRPPAFASLCGAALAMVLFHLASSEAWLLAARFVQGIATGMAAATFGAALLDVSKKHGALLGSVFPITGTALGALVASLLVEFAAAPERAIFLCLLIVFVLLIFLVHWMPETAEKRAGGLASLVPHVAVPAEAKRPLASVVPVLVAAWALAGFNLSLMPSLVRAATGSASALSGGLVVSALAFAAAVAVCVVRNWAARTILLSGGSTLLIGAAATAGGMYVESLPPMVAGTLTAGFGFGAAFYGALRLVMPHAGPAERAGLLSAIYVVCYLAFSLPTIGAGFLVLRLGLVPGTYVYIAFVTVLAAISLLATLAPSAGSAPRRR